MRLTHNGYELLTQAAVHDRRRTGGSDVWQLTTTAVQDGDHWRLSGEKWFSSNADASGDAAARPQGRRKAAPAASGLFLMPRRLEDGSQNYYRIVRLKDKLGTRSMASGEIKLEGAIAYAVG